jgi:hypothetical protein
MDGGAALPFHWLSRLPLSSYFLTKCQMVALLALYIKKTVQSFLYTVSSEFTPFLCENFLQHAVELHASLG